MDIISRILLIAASVTVSCLGIGAVYYACSAFQSSILTEGTSSPQETHPPASTVVWVRGEVYVAQQSTENNSFNRPIYVEANRNNFPVKWVQLNETQIQQIDGELPSNLPLTYAIIV